MRTDYARILCSYHVALHHQEPSNPSSALAWPWHAFLPSNPLPEIHDLNSGLGYASLQPTVQRFCALDVHRRFLLP